MQSLTAYKTTDGMLFENEKRAKDHQLDLIGEALDTLIPDAGGNITRVDRHRLLMAMLEDPKLAQKVYALQSALSED